jgi:hypothetical protein
VEHVVLKLLLILGKLDVSMSETITNRLRCLFAFLSSVKHRKQYARTKVAKVKR